MKKQYKQITIDERDLIAIHRANGFSMNDIAKMLGRNKSTISRELTRNSAKQSKTYLPHQAQKRAQIRKKQAAMKEELKCHKIKNFVKNKLKDGWSPEIIEEPLPLALKNLKSAMNQFISIFTKNVLT